ncbi:MAG: HK97 family phage prohead protease [Hyphomonadaceae bacterium]|nr:HK97 family phage prohead protease [Hyphomonadaceae bacterium]
MIVEGYASLFGVADEMRDVIRAGAFRASLARREAPLPMLLEHSRKSLAGYWSEVREDQRGLYVRGEIRADAPGAWRAKRALARGVDGLSIGFVPVVARRLAKGRMLEEIELLEVSIVSLPMQPLARLRQSPVGNRQSAQPTANSRLPAAV